jgi:RNA polymerase sigma-70 factor (ECF subfamily)
MQAIAIASNDACSKYRCGLSLATPSLRGEGASSCGEAPLLLERRRAIHEAWARGRQSWPRVALDREPFVRHCERVLGDAPAAGWVMHGAELYLCCACAAGDVAAQAILSASYLVRLERQLLESNDDAELVQETMQALRIKLLVGANAKIGRFAARGPLGHWLRAAAKRTLLDVVRARRAQRQAEREVPVEVSYHEPDLVGAIGQLRYAPTFLDGLRQAIGQLEEPDRLLLKRAILEGSTIDVLGDIYAIHRSTASRRLRRIRQDIALGVRRQLKTQHRLADGDVDELARDLGGWLESGLRVILESA